MHDADWVRRATGGSFKRFVAACLMACLGAWVAFALAFSGLWATISGTIDALMLIVLAHLTLLVPYAAFPGVVVGAGLHLLLVAFRARGWMAYAVAGTVGGLALGIPTLPCSHGLHGMACVLGGWREWFVFAAMPGLGAALGFWAALRPDRERTEPAGDTP